MKRILQDARSTDIWVEVNEYAGIIAVFYQNLAASLVLRIARVVKITSERENIVKKVLNVVAYPMQVQGFTEEASAHKWLLGNR